jgi:hypothetical protein
MKSIKNKENNADQLNSSTFSKHSKKSQISNKADTKKRTFHNLLMESGGYGIGGSNFLGSKLGRTSFLQPQARSEMGFPVSRPTTKFEPKSTKSNQTSFSNMTVGTFFQLVNKPAMQGSLHNNMLFQAYKMEAMKLENDSMKDVNVQ